MGVIGRDGLSRWEKMEGADECDEKIFVSVRLRPLNEKERARNDVSDWECINDNTIMFRNNLPERSMLPTAYTFDRVFQCYCSTKEVYEEGAKEVALSVVTGINSSIFAYGQTSSGKTYTMSGITEHTVSDIFDYIQNHEERAFVLKFSALEIYNEAVRDLLSDDGSPLRLLDDPERGTIVEKLTEETLRGWSHFQELLSICGAQRQIGETSLNEMSSRSHQILRLTIESSAREFLGKDNSSTLEASVNFVDLAGSERASQTLSAGTRLKEGCHINRSLLTLGTVIRKLSKGRNGHIPYRDSKLTRILQSSLGGNSRTAIICTLSPARSHVEQSRNTLLFASCAKDVATNAQVNVVMSDKTLLKHLQRELARVESELRASESNSAAHDSAVLLREKDIQIEKMEKEIEELSRQRDLSQSRLENLLQVIEENQASRLWVSSVVGFDQPPRSETSSLEDEHSRSESSGVADTHYLDFIASRSSTSQNSYIHDGSNLSEHYPSLSGNPEEHFLSNSMSPRLPTSSLKWVQPDPCPSCKEITQGNDEDLEDLCKEVRCIEEEDVGVNRNLESNALFPEENEEQLPLTVTKNTYAKDEELLSSPVKGDIDSSHFHNDSTYGALEQKLQDVQKTIECLFNSFPEEKSPLLLVDDLSSSRGFKLARSRSCRATLMTGSSSPFFEKARKNENTLPSGSEKDFPGRFEGLRRKLSVICYGGNTESLSRTDSRAFEGCASEDELSGNNNRTSNDNDVTSIGTLVTEFKEMTDGKQLVDAQVHETEAKDSESEKTVKDIGLDPMQDDLEPQSNWLIEFERQQREIFELWHCCNVSLVHRTYFFLLFKGDPADSIYMEVERRRLSFLIETFSQGNAHKLIMEHGQVLTPASSMKNLSRERAMLSKQMLKKFTEEEREGLYMKWGIVLETKQRRLQLAHRLWTNTKDMNHIMESATIVAKLVGFLEKGHATKEMFGLRFTPGCRSRRSYRWKHSISSLM